MITEGILNRSNQLVRRSDAPSRDSSRYDASPGETVDNLNRKPGQIPLRNAQKTVELKDLSSNPVSELNLRSTGPEAKQDAEEMKQAEAGIKEMVSKMNQDLGQSSLHLRFGTDKESGLDYYQLYDKENGDVIKQFPPEAMLDMAANLKEMAGVIFNEKV